MKIKLFLLFLGVILLISGCTSGMAEAMGGPMAGAAIQYNNEQYSDQK